MEEPDRLEMYGELAPWFHLLTPPREYVEEAAWYRSLLDATADGPVRTVLELGSGGGNNASHLKAHYRMTLVDLSAAMLQVSRELNPELEHVLGDMRTIRLGRTFDAVFVHDAASYLTSEEDLVATVRTAATHIRPGGVALFAPDHVREAFRELGTVTDHGGSDDGPRGFRYLEWTWDPDPDDLTYVADYAFLVREADGTVRAVHDRHTCGAFPRAMWLDALRAAGFEPAIHHPDPAADLGGEVFVGRRVAANDPAVLD